MPGKIDFDLSDGFGKWSSKYSMKDLEAALDDLFQDVASDLGVNDSRKSAFLDFAGDRMADAKVPRKVLDAAIKWLRKGSPKAGIKESTDQVGGGAAKSLAEELMEAVDGQV